MNKEEIITLALEHGISSSSHNILAFAKAIQDKQRERDAKICDSQDGMHDWMYSDAIRANKE